MLCTLPESYSIPAPPELFSCDVHIILVSLNRGEKYISTGRARLCFDVQNCKKKETVHFDDTLMKRIAKHNKEAEIEKLDKKLKAKENRIKELEEKIEDREQRWKKIQEFVSEIYDLSLEDDYDYYDEDY